MKRILFILLSLFLVLQVEGQMIIRANPQARAVVSAATYPEMVTNGALADATGWSTSTGMTIGGGKADFDDTNDNGSIRQADADMVSSVEAETDYVMEFDITIASGNAVFYLASSNGLVLLFTTSNFVNGHNTKEFTTGADVGIKGIRIVARTTSSNAWSIDNISLKKR